MTYNGEAVETNASETLVFMKSQQCADIGRAFHGML